MPETRFKGLILQALQTGGQNNGPVGHFVSWDSSLQTKFCKAQDDTITHFFGDYKTDVTATWMSPDHQVGDIIFM